MNEYAKKSILEMARGGFLEVTDLEMTKAIANIMDPNTSATAKRKITVTIELKADDSRQNIGVSYTVKSALAPTNAVTTMLYVADEENVVEMVPQRSCMPCCPTQAASSGYTAEMSAPSPVRQRCLCCSAVATRSARPMRSWKRLASSAAPAARATAASVLYPSLLIVGRFVHQAPR